MPRLSSSDEGEDGSASSGGIYSRPRRNGGNEGSASSGPSNANRTGSTSDSIYSRPRRRTVRRDRSDPGIFSRLTGRHRLEEIREERYRPYTYESNQQNLKWTAIAMGLWCLVMLVLAWTDFSNSNRYEGWIEAGVQEIPPSADLAQQIESARVYAQREGGEEFNCAFLNGRETTPECPDGELDGALISDFVDTSAATCWQLDEDTGHCVAVWSSYGILEFAKQTGLDCPNVDAVISAISNAGAEYPECDQAFRYAEDFQASQDRSRLIWLLALFIGIFVAFPYLSLVHRASRNLLPLKSEAQKDRPEWAVLHHFLPLLNLYRVGRVLMDLYKGSDPDVSTHDGSLWKKQGKVRPIVFVWWILWVGSWLFNPITVPRYVNAQTLEELVNANDLLVMADFLLIALGVVGVLMLRQLHVWQEMRYEKVGPLTVTPPAPPDPLEEALRKQEEKQRKQEERKRRR